MGGFRFNGCGVTDHFKRIKTLGMHNCPTCKKLREFTLDEANQKIDILWIPTLTLKSRYAVKCKNCKTGEFCSTEWAGYLMNLKDCPNIIFESEATERGWTPETKSFLGTAQQPAGAAIQTQTVSPDTSTRAEQTNTQSSSVQSGQTDMQPSSTQSKQTDTQHSSAQSAQSDSQPASAVAMQSTSRIGEIGNGSNSVFFKCSYCGVRQLREGNFCAYCGKPAPVPESPKQNASANESAVRAAAKTVVDAHQDMESVVENVLDAMRSDTHGTKIQAMQDSDVSTNGSNIICPNCGNKQDAGSKFCFQCGRKMDAKSSEEKTCPHCGAKVNKGMLFCMECGTRMT